MTQRKHIQQLGMTLVVSLSLTLPGCGSKQNRESAGRPYKAVVLDLTSVDANGSARFSLIERSFFGLNDLDALDGTYVRFLRGGELTVSEVNGSIVASDSFTGGQNPSLRYTMNNGVVIASDYSSLAMLSAYYQFDLIYSRVADVLGVASTDLQSKLPGGKHTVLFEPQIVFKLAEAEGSIGIKLNAAFSPKDKGFLLFQRSAIETVPLSSNQQVLSHEFGHSVFDYAFSDGAFIENDYLGETFAMRGINEGFADFVSWAFTTSPDILRASIDIKQIADERHITKTTFKWDNVVAQSTNDAAYDAAGDYARCADSFYCIGTLFARSLISAKSALTNIDNKTFASGIITSIRSARTVMNALPEATMPKPSESDGDAPLFSWSRQGQFAGGFLRALLTNVPSAWRSSLCSELISNFGDEGFPVTSRDGVCP